MSTKQKLVYDKVAVFDLDGTLWLENSHTYLVEKYFNIHGIKRMYYKAYGKLFPQENMKKLNSLFDQIPQQYIESFCPTINGEIADRLDKYKFDGWKVMIITSAPWRIVQIAKKIFGVEVCKTQIACKGEYLSNMKIDCLHVISDNETDIDIINQADQAFVLIDRKNQNFFERNKSEKMELLNKNTCKKGKVN